MGLSIRPNSKNMTAMAFVLVNLMMMGKMAVSLGINYGQIADNLPQPEKVVPLVKSLGATKVKLYDADPKVLKAFANTGIELMVTLGNDCLPQMAKDSKLALEWVRKNVQYYLPHSNITTILIGNEVLTYNDTSLTSSLVPTMANIHGALQTLQLDHQVLVTTAHNLAILQSSYPPSSGEFRQDLAPILTQILNFHAKTGSPFLINAYPYFAFKANPKQVSLDFVLFQPNQGILDTDSNLRYDNMLFAQIDAVYAAMGESFNKKVQIQVSETGWPSKGDEDEAGANPDNAKKYNGNLIKIISQKRGTPMKPGCDLNIFVFALFNENMKPGPTSERNYGLFKPDGTPAYSLGIPTVQAVGNLTAGPATTTTNTAAPPASPSSTGYLSISSAKERYQSVGSMFIFWALLKMMLA